MSTYRVYHTKAGVASPNTVMWQVRNPASRRTLVREIGIFCEVPSTVAPQFRLTRSLTLGATPTSVVPQPGDPDSPAANTVFDVAWGTAPTFTTAGPFYDGWPQFNTAGAGVIYQYTDLWVPAGTAATSGLQIVNLVSVSTTVGTWAVRFKFDE
jgi:hypothetical protein